jgi:large subunit ribosomal protein L25
VAGIVLNVEVREKSGTGAARASRNAGNVPGVLYGGARGPVSIEAPRRELDKALRSGKFVAHMVTLSYKGETQPVIPKAIHYHPVTDEPLHFDLYRVEENAMIDVDVPVRFLNQETCPGLKKGGALNIVRHTVSLKVMAGNIPEEITVDLANTEIGDVIHISAVTLPAGAAPTIQDRDFTIATLIGRGGKQEEEGGEAAS